jgi:hypothetical protein
MRTRTASLFLRPFGLLFAVLLALFAGFAPSALANDTPGNNGTVKIHEGAGENANGEVRNEPHVCTFHLHFYFSDPQQSGNWEIQEWAPTGTKGTVVKSGTYDTAGDGEDRQPETGVYTLPDGHYKLFWDGDTDKHDKMKVFWVDCAAPEKTPTPQHTPAATPTETSDTPDESCGTDLDEIGDNDADNHPCPTPTPTATPAETSDTPDESCGTDLDEIGDNDADNHPCPTPTPTPPAGPATAPPTTAPTGSELPAGGGAGSPSPTGAEEGIGGTPPAGTPLSGGEEGIVGTPQATPPATDTAPSATSTEGWRAVVFGLALVTAATILLLPGRRTLATRAIRSRRDSDRSH